MSASQSDNWRLADNWRTPAPSKTNTRPAPPRENQNSNPSSSYHQRPQQSVDESSSRRDSPPDSIAEGRRVYLGNLLYRVKPSQIEEMLEANGFGGQYEQIHISVDAVTGRNPGYCFIDFNSRDEADNALAALGGVVIHDRPVKVGPCRPKHGGSGDYKPTFQRWGDWKGSRGSGLGRDGGAPVEGSEQGPYGAMDHLEDVKKAKPRAPRVYIGGLGKMINQVENDREIRSYLEGFKIVAISKRITPSGPDTKMRPGNKHYCFVDFESVEEAHAAIQAVNRRPVPGGRLRLQWAAVLPEALR